MQRNAPAQSASSNTIRLVISWLFVGIPLAWGILITLGNAAKLFR